ncbi:acyloxyacyl hydrolase [Flavobacteriaceae bacterium TK19130]|nr:acyloxyacyl hydrolase [Thermobacterium salinum]
MKRLACLFVLLSSFWGFSQEPSQKGHFVDANYFYGTILRHNKDISHLILNHPQGGIVGLNFETDGSERWHREYNYPDWGVSTVYHNPGYETLGSNIGLYGHFNFYFLKRHVMFRIGQGIAYASNPFDLEENFKNNAYGTRLLSTTYMMVNFNKKNIFKNIGIQGGISLVHYSNGNFKAPNSSTNSFTFNLGVNYTLQETTPSTAISEEDKRLTEPIHLNLVLRGGINESDYVGLGQHPFWVVSAYADKRISYKSSIHLGVDAFFATFLKEEIKYLAASNLDRSLSGDEDYKRVGVFIGHQLHFGKLSVPTQFGYYLYYPYDFEGRTYIRAGLQYQISDHWFASTTLKSHGAKVEGVEFGIGYRI